MILRRWRAGAAILLCAVASLGAAASGGARSLGAQEARVSVETSEGIVLSTVSPRFIIRSFGFGEARPLRITMQVSENFSVLPPYLLDTTFLAQDSSFTLRINRALTSGATVYWRALVEAGGRAAISDITGPRVVPTWVTLVDPASPTGNIDSTRQPEFKWRSPRVDTGPGPWRYDLEIATSASNQTVFAVANLTDTIFRLPSPLQASTSYGWNVTARLAADPRSVRVESPGSLVIVDPAKPTATLLFQNFPNPFPTAASFSTCFWFDVGEPGAQITLEILDLRGNSVRDVIPGDDGQSLFPAGRYGRGAPGTGSNCDNRFVWDGTARDGRPVPPGVYLARFRAGDAPPTIRRILFKGR